MLLGLAAVTFYLDARSPARVFGIGWLFRHFLALRRASLDFSGVSGADAGHGRGFSLTARPGARRRVRPLHRTGILSMAALLAGRR